MIDTFQLATQGIGPGWSTFGFATQGFGFEVEVIIRPVTGGGGTVWHDDVPYEIIIRVKYKGKQWEERRFISSLTAKSLEKVIAWFKSFSIPEIISIIARKVNINIQSIFVKAKRK
jgi:hypothetical protein